MNQNKPQQVIASEMLDQMLIRLALQNAMKFPLERTATASVYAIPPGWETAVLKADGALPKALSSAELETLVQQGKKTIFIPKETTLMPGIVARQLDIVYADVAVFMEGQ